MEEECDVCAVGSVGCSCIVKRMHHLYPQARGVPNLLGGGGAQRAPYCSLIPSR